MMKKLYLLLLIALFCVNIKAQVVIDENYKSINIGGNAQGDYTKTLILLHEIYDNTHLGFNCAVGSVTAYRGQPWAYNRINVAEIKSTSAYNGIWATLTSFDDHAAGAWTLKTCRYKGKKYLALNVPYTASFHDWGYRFVGWTTSTGENMKAVNYSINDGQPVNQDLLTDIQDYYSNMNKTVSANNIALLGNVGIGTTSPDEKLSVNGKIHTQEVRVDMNGWPDYVFEDHYKITSLTDLEKYIKVNKHLPDMPSAKEVESNGLELGEIVKQQQKKIEELTLYIIEQNKRIEKLENK